MSESKLGIIIDAVAEPAIAGFNKTIEKVLETGNAIKALGTKGTDDAHILELIGQKGGEAFQQIIAQATAAGVPIESLKRSLSDLNQKMLSEARESAGQVAMHAAGQAMAFTQVAEAARAVVEVIQEIAAAAEKAEKVERDLSMAFDAGRVEEVHQHLRELNKEYGLNEQELAQAAKTAEKFGGYSQEAFDRIVHAARATGTGIDEAAAAYGRFQEKMDERSARGFFKAFGINPEEVAAAHGLLDETGKIILKTADDVKRFQDAMDEALNERGKHAVETHQRAWEQLGAEMEHWTADTGKGILEMQDAIAERALKMAKALDGAANATKNLNPTGFQEFTEGMDKALDEVRDKANEATKGPSLGTQAEQQIEEFNKKRQAGTFASKQAELEAINAIVKAYGDGTEKITTEMEKRLGLEEKAAVELNAHLREIMKERGTLSKEIAKQAEEDAKKAAEAQKRAAEEAFQYELHQLKNRVENGKMTAAQEITSLQEILQRHNLTVHQRMEVENQLTQVTKKEVDERQAHELRSLEILEAQGKATIQDRINLLEKQAKDPGLDQAKRDEKLLQAAQEHKKAKAEELKHQEELIKSQEELLRLQEEATTDVQKKVALQLQLVQLENQLATLEASTKSDAEKQTVEKENQLRLQIAQSKATEEMQKAQQGAAKAADAQAKSLEKAADAAGTFKQGGQSIKDAFANGNFGFSLSLGGSPTTSAGAAVAGIPPTTAAAPGTLGSNPGLQGPLDYGQQVAQQRRIDETQRAMQQEADASAVRNAVARRDAAGNSNLGAGGPVDATPDNIADLNKRTGAYSGSAQTMHVNAQTVIFQGANVKFDGAPGGGRGASSYGLRDDLNMTVRDPNP